MWRKQLTRSYERRKKLENRQKDVSGARENKLLAQE